MKRDLPMFPRRCSQDCSNSLGPLLWPPPTFSERRPFPGAAQPPPDPSAGGDQSRGSLRKSKRELSDEGGEDDSQIGT